MHLVKFVHNNLKSYFLFKHSQKLWEMKITKTYDNKHQVLLWLRTRLEGGRGRHDEAGPRFSERPRHAEVIGVPLHAARCFYRFFFI